MKQQYYTKITSKGQITIPTKLRNNLSIPIGSKIELIQQDNCIIMLPLVKSLDKLQKVLPKAHKKLSIKEMDDIIQNRLAPK